MEPTRRWALIRPAGSTPQLPPIPYPRFARQNISTACSACRAKRVKCSGETPCSSCATKGQACEYNQEQDQRRKTGVKRKIDDLESQNSFLTNQLRVTQTELQQALRILRRLEDPGGLEESEDIDNADTATTEMSDVSLVKRKHVDELEEEYGFLRSIYDWIRESPRLSSMTVIDLIRDSANPGEAIRALTQQRFEESIHTWRKRHQTPPIMSLPPLFTRPPYLVPAKPWTTVTSNDGLVSHLLSLYFHWDYPIYHFLDRRLFLSDMAAGRTRFCSKMLVNAVLAHACLYAHTLDKPWDRRYEFGMAIRFLAEAHRLRMLEGGAEKLTTVQALIMINIIYNSMGKDRIGSEYLPPAISMAINLDIFSPSSKENGTIHDGEERLVRAVTAWGLYDWQSRLASALGHYPLLTEKPAVDFPYADGDWTDDDEPWQPYPFKEPLFRASLYSTFKARASLSETVAKITIFTLQSYGDDVVSQIREFDSLHAEMQAWMTRHGNQLDPFRNPIPHAIMLHIYYHLSILNLCNSTSTFAPRSYQIQISNKSKLSIRELILLYKRTFGWKSAPSFINHPLSYTAHLAIPFVKQGHPRWRLCFDVCVSGLWHLSFSFAICRYLLRALQHSLGDAGIAVMDLPADAGKTLDYFATSVWRPELRGGLRSEYCVVGEGTVRPLERLVWELD